jgi:RNA polymerase sigma-70 factor, ECF subfamily
MTSSERRSRFAEREVEPWVFQEDAVNKRSSETQTPSLLQMAQSGDRAAFEMLLVVARKLLSRLARTQISRQLQGKADASDLVQEALLEVHRHFGQFRGTTEAEFGAWLRSILAGLVANHVRHFMGTQQRDVRLEQPIATGAAKSSSVFNRQLASTIGTPSQEAVRHEGSVQLVNALESLPEHYRQVITLRHVEGLPFSEVARQMGRSVDSVEKLWVRALNRLRELLRDSDEYEPI